MDTKIFEKKLEAQKVFTPTTPIDEKDLFSGRTDQLSRIIECIGQKGQHAIIFGERGVGKTSLANVLSQFLGKGPFLSIKATCDTTDDYSSLWRKIFSEVSITNHKTKIGFTSENSLFQESLASKLPEEISPDLVRKTLDAISQNGLSIIIIDEFDRIPESVSLGIADTIKCLSDFAINATIILVGVADSVAELIKEHSSIERALIQVPMPRMSGSEIKEIINKGMERLQFKINPEAIDRIALLAQGLPHYAHLLCLYSTYSAIEDDNAYVTTKNVQSAISKSIENAQMSIRTSYVKATSSPRKENLYSQVLLACALAPTDELGYFSPAAVREPMTVLMERPYDIPSFSRHLYDFTEAEKGPILERIGRERKYRYRFKNPLLQPYIIMKGMDEKILNNEKLKKLTKE